MRQLFQSREDITRTIGMFLALWMIISGILGRPIGIYLGGVGLMVTFFFIPLFRKSRKEA